MPWKLLSLPKRYNKIRRCHSTCLIKGTYRIYCLDSEWNFAAVWCLKLQQKCFIVQFYKTTVIEHAADCSVWIIFDSSCYVPFVIYFEFAYFLNLFHAFARKSIYLETEYTRLCFVWMLFNFRFHSGLSSFIKTSFVLVFFKSQLFFRHRTKRKRIYNVAKPLGLRSPLQEIG